VPHAAPLSSIQTKEKAMEVSNPNKDMASLVNTSNGAYMEYFASMGKILHMLVGWSEQWSGGALVTPHAAPYLSELHSCIELLRSRYAYEIHNPMVVDLSLSGFPHAFMFSQIKADEARAKQVRHMSSAELKKVFVDTLFAKDETNKTILNAVSEALYFERLQSTKPSLTPLFVISHPVPHATSVQKLERITWAMYDGLHNVPCIFGLVFERANSSEKANIRDHIAHLVMNMTPAQDSLASIAEHLDDGVLIPKYLSRMVVGPLTIPPFTTREGALAEGALALGCGDEVIIEVTVDHTYVSETITPSTLAVTLGASARRRHVYHIDIQSAECMERGSSKSERFAMVSHKLYQHLPQLAAEKKKNLAGTIVYPYNQKGVLLCQDQVVL
jgi:hypothetical protein